MGPAPGVIAARGRVLRRGVVVSGWLALGLLGPGGLGPLGPGGLELNAAEASVSAVGESPGTGEASAQTTLAPPPNDTCGGASIIPDGPYPVLSSITTMVDMATGAGDPLTSCIPDPVVENGVWYVWTPAVSRQYILKTCNPPTATTDGDGVLAIYTSSGGCAGTFTQVSGTAGCGDDGCHANGPSIIGPLSLTGGTTYYVLASHYPTDSGGGALINQYQISIEVQAPPPNDTCAGAIPLMLDMPFNGTNTLAANDYQLVGSTCFGGIGQTAQAGVGRDSVYSFTASAADTYSFRAWNTVSGGNLVLYAASTCPSAPPTATVSTCLAASNRKSSANPFVSEEEVFCLALSAGQQVFLYVDEALLTPTGGAHTVEVTRCRRESEPNDAPAGAGSLSCGIEGSIGPANNPDFFGLGSPPSGSRVFAFADAASSNDADFQMRITTAADTLEFDDRDGDASFGAGGQEPSIAGTPLPGSGAFIRISHFSSAVQAEPYRLFSVVQPPIGSATAESEPNDSPEEADTAANLYFHGQLDPPSPSSDIDAYRFCADKGDLVYLSLDGDPIRDATQINGLLALYDKYAGSLIQVNDDGFLSSLAPGTGSLTATSPYSPSEALVWRARYSGVYYAVVAIDPASIGSTGAGDYLLSIATDCANGGQMGANLTVAKVDGPDPVAVGANLTYTITATNAGPDIAMDATLSEATPPNTTFVSLAAPPDWTCSVPAAGSTGAIACTTACLPTGPPAVFTLVVKVNYCVGNGSQISGMAAISAATPDPVPGDNVALASTSVSDPCVDATDCTNDTCNAQNGSCSHTTKANGAPCSDGNPCTANDVCTGSACGGTAIVVPSEVTHLRLTSKTVLAWDSAAAAGPGTVHDVARGRADELPVGAGASEICLAPGIAPASTSDLSSPPAGRSFWYLARGRNSCGAGTYGNRSNGAPRVTAVCP